MMNKILQVTVLPLLLALCLLVSGCAPKPAETTLSSDGKLQTIKVTIHQGYHPDKILAKAGIPLQLTFYRDEQGGACGEHLLMPDQKVNITLPDRQPVTLDIPPQKPGEIMFSCGMHMLLGRITFE